jgi:putative transposase
MGVIKFKINSKIFYEDNEYIIKSYPSVDKVLLKQNTSPYKEIIVKVNDLIKDSKNANEPEKSQVEYEDKALDKATEKYKIIKPLLEIENRTAKDVEKRAKRFKKGIATLYRWIETFEKYGTVSSLAGNRQNCGAKGKSRLPQETEDIINTIINEVYLDEQQLPFSNIYNVIVNECKKEKVQIPGKGAIRHRINNISPKLIAKHRKNLNVRETRGMTGKFPEVKLPLDIIQIDHTKVDVILVDEETREEIGRPFITVAIDMYSRMIYGFYISLNAPSYFSVGQCFLNAVLPKDDFLNQHEVKGEWPVYGLPRKIHMDNGKDFRSISLHGFCSEFGIEDIYRPVARPEFGGAVERVIGTFMKKTHELPGSTFSNIFEKGKYKSGKKAAVTVSELEQWYVDFIVNAYHKTVHSSLGMTPEEKFYQGLLGVGDEKEIPFLPIVPADTIKFRMSLLPKIKRSVQKNGITIDYITYFSEALRKWIIPSQYKKLKPNLINEIECRRDPRDISKIYVYDEDIKEYIIIPYADIRKPAMDLTELRRSISEAKKTITGRELEPHDIFEAHERLNQYILDAKKETKTVRRQKSTKIHQKKTLEYESKVLDINPKKGSKLNLTKQLDEEDDGYDIYPIG